MRLTIITICAMILVYFVYQYTQQQPKTSEPILGQNGRPLTDKFQVTYVHTGSFETPAYTTFEKVGVKVHIMPPDTLKSHPLILSDWKVAIDSTDKPRVRYRSGDFEKLPKEVQDMFWF